jgi:phosphatidylglycerophosphate synthase
MILALYQAARAIADTDDRNLDRHETPLAGTSGALHFDFNVVTEMWLLSSKLRRVSNGPVNCANHLYGGPDKCRIEGRVNDTEVKTAGKPQELQGFLNRTVYHPLAHRLAAALAHTPATPNMVSVAGAVLVGAAGVLYALVGTPWAIALGFAIHLSWHVVDGADGALARMTGRASPRGEIVDGLCDYAGHATLYVLLATRLDDAIGGAAWGIVVAAGLSRAVQSVFAESQRRTYQWWAYGIPWLQSAKAQGRGIGVALSNLYLAAWRAMSGPTQRVNALVASAEADPPERARIAGIARDVGRAALPVAAMLGANPRTIMLGLSMIAGTPLFFFLIEIVLLNIVLAFGIVQAAAIGRRIAQQIARGHQ